MSTKIHFGFKLKTIKTLDEAFLYFRSHAKNIQNKVNEAHAKEILEKSIKIHDINNNNLVEKEHQENHAIWKVSMNLYEKIYEDQRKQKRNIDDKTIEIALAPFEGNIYGLFFIENNHSLEIFKELEEIENFNYWNSTDKPNSITEHDWEERSRIWDSVLDLYIPKKCMFSFILAESPFMIDKELFESLPIPSIESRLEWLLTAV